MEILTAFFGTAAHGIITVYSLFLLIRVILPFLPIDEDGPFTSFIYTVTEPLVHFVRNLLERVPGVSDMPIDLSIVLAYMLLCLVDVILLAL